MSSLSMSAPTNKDIFMHTIILGKKSLIVQIWGPDKEEDETDSKLFPKTRCGRYSHIEQGQWWALWVTKVNTQNEIRHLKFNIGIKTLIQWWAFCIAG